MPATSLFSQAQLSHSDVASIICLALTQGAQSRAGSGAVSAPLGSAQPTQGVVDSGVPKCAPGHYDSTHSDSHDAHDETCKRMCFNSPAPRPITLPLRPINPGPATYQNTPRLLGCNRVTPWPDTKNVRPKPSPAPLPARSQWHSRKLGCLGNVRRIGCGQTVLPAHCLFYFIRSSSPKALRMMSINQPPPPLRMCLSM